MIAVCFIMCCYQLEFYHNIYYIYVEGVWGVGGGGGNILWRIWKQSVTQLYRIYMVLSFTVSHLERLQTETTECLNAQF